MEFNYKIAKAQTMHAMERNFDTIIINYMKIYEKYYKDGNRDCLFLKELVDSIQYISACLEVYNNQGELNPKYAMEKLERAIKIIEDTESHFERKLLEGNINE